MNLTKNKELLFEFQTDWKQLKGKWNWYSFTFLEFRVEHEKWLKAYDIQITLLGFGLYVRFNYDVDFLNKKLSEWKSEEFDD